MKRLYLSLFILAFSMLSSYSQTPCNSENGISIEVGESCYIIDVEYPLLEMIDRVLLDDQFNEYLFKEADFGFNEEEDSPFKFFQRNGGPKIPFLSINLQIPNNSYVETFVESIEFEENIDLDAPYIPVQNVSETDVEVPHLQYNEELYHSSSLLEPAYVSSPYTYMGTHGINVTLKPFIYDFTQHLICPIHRIRYIVCVSGNESLLEMYHNTIEQENLADAVKFYNTYCGDELVYPDYKGNYMIITTPEFEDEAEMYAQHKNNLGYHAWVETYNSDFCDPTFIRHQLKTYYDYEDMRPRYLLIIGSHDIIPYSYGVIDDDDNPLTDIYIMLV